MLVGVGWLCHAFFVADFVSGYLFDANGGWWVGEDVGAALSEVW